MLQKIRTGNGAEVKDLNHKKAIRRKCIDCQGWSTKAVRECSDERLMEPCPLNAYRMGNNRSNKKVQAKAIRSYCIWCMNSQYKEIDLCIDYLCSLWAYRLANMTIDHSIEIT